MDSVGSSELSRVLVTSCNEVSRVVSDVIVPDSSSGEPSLPMAVVLYSGSASSDEV